MEKFLATKVDDKSIELKSSNELEELYKLLDKDENFILQWVEGNDLRSEVKVATNISGKVKTGEIVLKSREAKK
jgi:hypothetical protein